MLYTANEKDFMIHAIQVKAQNLKNMNILSKSEEERFKNLVSLIENNEFNKDTINEILKAVLDLRKTYNPNVLANEESIKKVHHIINILDMQLHELTIPKIENERQIA